MPIGREIIRNAAHEAGRSRAVIRPSPRRTLNTQRAIMRVISGTDVTSCSPSAPWRHGGLLLDHPRRKRTG